MARPGVRRAGAPRRGGEAYAKQERSALGCWHAWKLVDWLIVSRSNPENPTLGVGLSFFHLFPEGRSCLQCTGVGPTSERLGPDGHSARLETVMATTTERKGIQAPKTRNQPWWTPRIWLGGNFSGLFRLLARNGFRISPSRLHIAVTDLTVSAFHSALGGLQSLALGRRVASTEIQEPPLFILGHWRTGTTLLHELMILDQRHAFPNMYRCFCPNHFLLTEKLARRFLGFIVPRQRVMDNMKLGWDRPQEDEFALCNLGLPSPYLSIAFPNQEPHDQDYFDLQGIEPRQRERWKRLFLRFVRQLTYRDPKRLVFKSPTHTCRIKVLLELFPEARFVHIVRDPYVVFPSTVHLWKSLYLTQGLQVPNYRGLEENVFRTYSRMYTTLEETRGLVAPNRFHELRYEDLVHDPVNQIQRIYSQLDLGDFEPVRPALERYLEDNQDYKTNSYKLDPEVRDEITRRWGEQIEKYGYQRAELDA